ncbi:ferritin-like domain-containing protein [Pendulispora brunnea]|uniref:Ferritin-like domain-containing protein n=1 Tax=Pendulispora brunnea TaxID=2905690 RepID=A0ABZ2KH45_9BACT
MTVWVLQTGLLYYWFTDRAVVGFNAILLLAGLQLLITAAAGITVKMLRTRARLLGVPRGGDGAALLFFIVGGIGSVTTLGISALVAFVAFLAAGMAHGRSLRVRGRPVTADVHRSMEWAKGSRPNAAALDAATRDALTELWLHDAKGEHASVPAFSQVAWDLAALGAPPNLLARAHKSALDEIDHAQRCFALASEYAGHPLGPAAMADLNTGMRKRPRNRERALIAVARETLLDGAFLESYSAELARAGLEDATDPAVREVLARIAQDESEHAELAWDILVFCIDAGGAPVARALHETAMAIGELPPAPYRREQLGLVALADPRALCAHGRVGLEKWAPIYAGCRKAILGRLEGLLGTRHNGASLTGERQDSCSANTLGPAST